MREILVFGLVGLVCASAWGDEPEAARNPDDRAVSILTEFGFTVTREGQTEKVPGDAGDNVPPPAPASDGQGKPVVAIVGSEFVQNFSDRTAPLAFECLKLRKLDVRDCYITPVGMSQVGKCVELQELIVYSPALDDRIGKSLVKCRNLERLELDNASLTDESIDWIEKLPKLRRLSLQRTLISPAGQARLAKRLPNCDIAWQPRPEAWTQPKRPDFDGPGGPGINPFLLLHRVFTWSSTGPLPPFCEERLAELDRRLAPKQKVKVKPENLVKYLDEIGYWGRASSIELLAKYVRDEKQPDVVRQKALMSLSHISDPSVVPILIECMKDRSLGTNAADQLELITHSKSLRKMRLEANPKREQLRAEWERWWNQYGEWVQPDRRSSFTILGG